MLEVTVAVGRFVTPTTAPTSAKPKLKEGDEAMRGSPTLNDKTRTYLFSVGCHYKPNVEFMEFIIGTLQKSRFW